MILLPLHQLRVGSREKATSTLPQTYAANSLREHRRAEVVALRQVQLEWRE